MKQVIFILSLFTIIILGFTDDVTNRLAELLSMSKIDVEICMNKTSVNINDLMKLDELVDDDIMTKDINDAALKVGCLFVCLLQKKDIMSGVYINVEKMKKILDIKMHSKNMFRYVVMRNRILDTCADRVKSKTDECEVILLFYLCINAEVRRKIIELDFSNAVYKRGMFSEQLNAVRSERSMFSERKSKSRKFRIMKQAIFILCLCIAITAGLPLEDIIDRVADELSMSKTDVQICFTKTNVNLTDLMMMDEFFYGEVSAEINKSTLKVSCLLACLLKKKELMVNTQINVERIKKLIAAKEPTSDPTTISNKNRILDTCVDRVKGKTNECDVVCQFLLCIVEKLKNLE
ncbi:uncharacterized protein LOC105423946 [Pogonomyrmex barbatus]|uniref:Uncharacterized protein LOC105423946 n=1 Tax=Pogonomyrmex barbatus TaxID=144034 RepID=A0A6I9W1L8_9HYME|nr:uncharacterized protein LOC105423946 [Pogonomyrmex barbatus]